MRLAIFKRAFYSLSSTKSLPYLIAFAISVVVFGILYYILTPYNHGVLAGSTIPDDFDLLQGLYFSVVTISSLGYGDFHPVGFSKVLASIEVIFGLSCIGIIIASFTSRQISHLVSRLFVSDARKQLHDFGIVFGELERNFKSLLFQFSKAYAVTPGTTNAKVETKKLSEEFRDSVRKMQTSSTKVWEYLKDESVEKGYFDLVPPHSLVELLNLIHESLYMLSQCLISLPEKSKPMVFEDILNRTNRSHILGAIRDLREVSTMYKSHSSNEQIIEQFRLVEDTCDKVSDALYQVPREEQPDQVMDSSTSPELAN